MPEILPFRALHYDAAKVGDLGKVVSQPYDKVDDRLRDTYYARHPRHIVRLDKRKDEPGDAGGERKYAAAAAELQAWMNEGVLVDDAAPALWVTHQVYRVEGRTRTRKGLCAMVRLEEYGKGRIHPHEETHTGPKTDRLKLLSATGVHFGHIFFLTTDPGRKAGRVMDAEAAGRPPDLRAVDDFGDEHQAWRIADPGPVAEIRSALEAQDAVIADGHHRYETALGFRAECAGRRCDGAESCENVLATLVDMDDEGLTCLGTHRVIRDKPPIDAGDFLKRLAPDFAATDYPWAGPEEERRARAKLLEDLRTEGRKLPAIGLALPGERHLLLRVRDLKATVSRIAARKSEEWRSLDNNILHSMILEPVLGITPEDTTHERFVDYVRSPAEAAERVLSGMSVGAFLVNPVRMDQILQVARRGERFPQKSTDFYPKMITGLLMCRLHFTRRKP